MTLQRSDWPWIVALGLFAWSKYKRKGKPGTPKREGVPEPYHKIPKVFTIEQLRELSVAIGMAEPDVAAAIAMAESSGRTGAVGDKGRSIGLWQINLDYCPKRFRNADMLKNAGFNAEAAHAMSNGGTDWSAWPSFKQGRHKPYLPKS